MIPNSARRLLLALLVVGTGCQSQPTPPAAGAEPTEVTPTRVSGDSLLALLPALERRIAAGDTAALRPTLRLRRVSDGHVSEEVDITLGAAIRRMPGPLLRALREEDVPDTWIGGIVGNLGPEFVDRFDAQRAERAARRDSLLTVTSPALVGLRDRLVAELDTHQGSLPRVRFSPPL